MCRLWGQGGKERLELFEGHLHCPMAMASLCQHMSTASYREPSWSASSMSETFHLRGPFSNTCRNLT